MAGLACAGEVEALEVKLLLVMAERFGSLLT